jgi:hypothetical protein
MSRGPGALIDSLPRSSAARPSCPERGPGQRAGWWRVTLWRYEALAAERRHFFTAREIPRAHRSRSISASKLHRDRDQIVPPSSRSAARSIRGKRSSSSRFTRWGETPAFPASDSAKSIARSVAPQSRGAEKGTDNS